MHWIYCKGEKNTYYGIVLPTILILQRKLHALLQTNLIYCKPVCEALLKGREKRIENVLKISGPEAENVIIASLSYPRLKNKWFFCIPNTEQARLKQMF